LVGQQWLTGGLASGLIFIFAINGFRMPLAQRFSIVSFLSRRLLIHSSILIGLVSPFAVHAEEVTPDEFEAPGVILETLSGDITLLDGAAPESNLELVISNPAASEFDGEIYFYGNEPHPFVVPPEETITIALTPLTRHAGDAGKMQKVEIDLALIINDAPAPPVNTTDIDLKIPTAAFPIVRAEPPIMERSREDEFAYEYYALSQQLQPLKLTYNPGPVNLKVRKTVYPIPVVAGPVEISIEVINYGESSATNLTLRDSLEDADFSTTDERFTRFASADGVAELVWEESIESLAPGESLRLKYIVNARSDVGNKQLPATTVIMNDELTGLSNKVWLPKWH
jgi:hypothetical protein